MIEIEKVNPIIGMRVIDAIEYLDDTQIECRIIKEDGKVYTLTQEIKDNRVNIEIFDDIVKKIDGIY